MTFEIWAIANILTGVFYFAIPIEIWHWTRVIKTEGLQAIGWLFIAFIVFCGSHHVVMPFTGHAHMVEWWNLITDAPMAVVSGMTHYTIFHNRERIKAALTLGSVSV